MKTTLLALPILFCTIIGYGQEEKTPDTTRVNLKKMEILIIDKSGEIDTIDAAPEEGVKSKRSYEAHWAGIDMGFNVMMNNAMSADFGTYEYWENDPARSMTSIKRITALAPILAVKVVADVEEAIEQQLDQLMWRGAADAGRRRHGRPPARRTRRTHRRPAHHPGLPARSTATAARPRAVPVARDRERAPRDPRRCTRSPAARSPAHHPRRVRGAGRRRALGAHG